MLMGKGSVTLTSIKQKLMARSSTEAEAVAVDDVMPMILWTRQFIEAQGHTVSDDIVCQDNQSVVPLEKNGKAASRKRTRHNDIRCHFVTDRASEAEPSIEHCPTDHEMRGDFFTKPTQGSNFMGFRKDILNLQE